MSDTTLITAVMAQLNIARSQQEALSVIIGEKGIAAHGTPPRVVWVPTTGGFAAPRPGVGVTAARQILMDLADYDAHCWGDGIDGARALMHEVVRAARLTCGMYLTVGRYEWKEAGGVEAEGACVIVRLTFSVGVSDKPFTFARIQHAAGVAHESVPENGITVQVDVPPEDP